MSDTIIVELNQNTSDWQRPGEYHVQLSQPITINEGDQLSFRMCAIDSNKTDADTIIIEDDQPISVLFSYYDVNYDNRDKQTFVTNGPVTPDFQYYAAYNDLELEILTGIDLQIVGFHAPTSGADHAAPDYTWPGGSFVIQGGNTSPVASIDRTTNILFTFSYLDQEGNIQSFQCTGQNWNYIQYEPAPSQYAPGYSCIPPNANYPGGTFPAQAIQDNNFIPFPNVTIRKGSIRLAGVSGNWPGVTFSPAHTQTITFGPNGAYPPGVNLNNYTNPYDSTYPYLLNQFGIYRTYSTPSPISVGLQLDTQLLSVTLPAGRYEPQSLAVKMTQLLSDAQGVMPVPAGSDQLYTPTNPLLSRTDIQRNAGLLFRKVDFALDTQNIDFNDINSYTYYDESLGGNAAYYIGASEVSIEYGEAGGLFQVSYLHTPLNNPSTPGEQDIGLYYNLAQGVQEFFVVKSATGVAIHQLQPVEFWKDQLGLYSNLIVPIQYDSSGVQYYTLDSLTPKITYGFQGLDTFFIPHQGTGNPIVYSNPRKVDPPLPALNPTYFNITGQSRAIIAESVSVNLRGGYFLIEVLGMFRNQGGYIDADENRARIAAVVSTQYDSNNSITGFSDSGIPYVHRGTSYLITEATVRILDPLTKKPVTSLGENNTIWIQIEKLLTPLTPTPSPKVRPVIKKRIL
jgi:hypothetical protein